MPLVTTVEDAQKMYDDMIKKDLLLTEDDIVSKKGHIKFQRRGGWNFALPEVEQGTNGKFIYMRILHKNGQMLHR